MTLKNLFEVVSDQQEVRLIGDDFGEIVGIAEGLDTALGKEIIEMAVSGVEATYDGVLKVWVGEICKVI